MQKEILLATVLSVAVCCTAFAGPHGGPGGFRGPGGPGGPRFGVPMPPGYGEPGYYHDRGHRCQAPPRVYNPQQGRQTHPQAYNPGGRDVSDSRERGSYSGNSGIFDSTVHGIYQHLNLAYKDAYKASLILAEGFHKDEAANQLVASGTALQDIADQDARNNLHLAMQNCLPTQDEMAQMYVEHQEELRAIMQDAKAYQKSTNKHFGWFGFNLVLAVATCPGDRRDELVGIIDDAQASIKRTKAMFKNFDASYKSMQQLLGNDDKKEIQRKAKELKQHAESSYGL